MADKVTITINRKIWKELAQFKLDWGMRTFDEVLEKIIKGKK